MDSRKTTNASVLGEMKPSKAIIKLAVPATLALLAKAVYNIVDTAYIGMLHSDTALAAVGVTLPLLLIMVSVENIFSAGAAVLAGRQLGAKDQEGANTTVTTIVALSVVIGMILCVGGLFFMEPLLRSFGASDAVLDVYRRAGQSAGPKLELCRQGGIFRQNFFHSRHHRRRPKCSSGPCFHVRLGLGYGRAGSLPGHNGLSVCHIFHPAVVLFRRTLHH